MKTKEVENSNIVCKYCNSKNVKAPKDTFGYYYLKHKIDVDLRGKL